jgi:eukaryotic-like serine/threonine-protein kinase
MLKPRPLVLGSMNRAALLNSYIGEYLLVDFLGAGGMGEVYRGVHSKIGRVVAIKVLTQAVSGPAFIERFLNEARIQASLHHQNIATLYDFLEFNGQPCIVMEYVDGLPLVESIAARGGLPPAEALRIFQAVVEAIQYIHSQGIVHRDIKSNNIKVGSTGDVKLLDFGIARGNSTPSLTMTGDVVGTLQYLAPEQVKGGTADQRSDTWALGALLYEMVTGKAPFESPTIGQLCEKIGKAAYAPAAALNAAVPQDVEAIIARCLKKKPSERYQTARDLLDDVRRLALAPSSPSSRKTDRRLHGVTGENWRALSIVAGVVFALLVGIVLFLQPSGGGPGELQRQAANKNTASAFDNRAKSSSNARTQGEMKSYLIEAVDGAAEVYLNGQKVGTTPYEFKAQIGERVNLLLKRSGYNDRREEITLGENKKTFSFSLSKN